MFYAQQFFLNLIKRTSLVTQIIIGLIAGILFALVLPAAAVSVSFIGSVFVSALKAVAPILVFVLVMASIASHKKCPLSSLFLMLGMTRKTYIKQQFRVFSGDFSPL